MPRESMVDRTKRAGKIFAILKKRYPGATCALHHSSPLELLVATILSAQSTDETVNRITPELFRRYPDAESIAAAPREGLEQAIRPSGLRKGFQLSNAF